jgi:hypothetical protein
MMSTDSDRFLKDDLERLRRQKGLCPLTPKEAEEELKAAPEHPLSPAETDSLLEKVTSGDLTDWEVAPTLDWANDVNTTDVEQDVLQLNRHPGNSNPEIDALIDELRKKALSDEDKPTGPDDGTNPKGERGSES